MNYEQSFFADRLGRYSNNFAKSTILLVHVNIAAV